MIHITDHQTDVILDDIPEDAFWQDKHKKSLKSKLETFDFITFADKVFSEYLTKQNRIIIPDEDNQLIEFYIINTKKYRDIKGLLKCDVYTSASYLTLKTAKVIDPHTTDALSAESHAQIALSGTEVEVGRVDFNGVRTLTFDEHTNPYAYLKRIASKFELELHFRVESNGNKIVRRYADLLERVGSWQGREAEFGKDLDCIERKENFKNIVTALKGIGPIREDETRLEVIVEDKEALQRWSRKGQHIIKTYEPQSTDQNMTLERLTTLTENELEKRVNSVIEYKANIVDLEKVIGLEHEKIRFGDTIKVKDTTFNPPLYLEARIHTQERSIKRSGKKTVRLGDYTEYTEDEVNAIWKSLQKQIQQKISMTELEQATYTQEQIDTKDSTVQSNAEADATQKANQAETNAETHADTVASQAESNANSYTNTVKSQIDQELLDKADVKYVDGQLTLKADSSTVNTLNTTVSDLQTAVDANDTELVNQGGRITTVETDLDTVEGDLSIVITDLSNLDGTVQQNQTDISANTSAITLKASQSEVDGLQSDVTSISNQVSTLQVDVNGISADVSSVQSTVDGHTTDISSLNSSMTILEDEISTKVGATYVDNAVTDLNTMTKLNGIQLIDDRYQGDLEADPFKTGSYSIIAPLSGSGTNWIETIDSQGLRSDFIPINIYNPYYIELEVYNEETSNGILYVGVEFFDENKQSMGPNELTMYAFSDGSLPVNTWVKKSGFVNIGSGTRSESSFVRLRILTRWSGNTGVTYLRNIQFKQLGIGNVLDPRLSTAESEITQLAGEIELKAEESTVTNLETRTTTAEQNISALEGAITSKVEESVFNSLEGRVDTAESTITQHSNQIALKVDEDGVIGAINLSSETAKIQAANIELQGAVTVLSNITGDLGTINAGTINGVNINGSAFTQSGTNGTITLDNDGFIFEGTNSSIEMNVHTTSGYHGDIASLVFKDDMGARAMEIYQYYTDATIRAIGGLVLEGGEFGVLVDGSNVQGSTYGVFLRGGVDIDGTTVVNSSGRSLIMKSAATGNFASTYVDFQNADGNRLGYFGFGSANNNTFYINNATAGGVVVTSDFSVTGSKSAIVDTDNYGARKMYALETPDNRFVAYTEHVLEEGEHVILIEPMFRETISNYFVVPHIQNSAEVTILERLENSFKVLVSERTAEVVFEVNGLRKGFEGVYMEQVEKEEEVA
ncbi:phage tail spike protein [Gracilibacillus sp. D59]|uniref:phage tail spike protein n=1 Tax=Gracilibacillus sp. D59 TaxID=3457434 RepID=UPI003FCCFED3